MNNETKSCMALESWKARAEKAEEANSRLQEEVERLTIEFNSSTVGYQKLQEDAEAALAAASAMVPKWIPATTPPPDIERSVTLLYDYADGERERFPNAYYSTTRAAWIDQHGIAIDLEYGKPVYWLHNPIPVEPTPQQKGGASHV